MMVGGTLKVKGRKFGFAAAVWTLCTAMLASGCSRIAQDSPPAPEAAEKKETVTLTYATWGSPNEKRSQEQIIAKFMEKYPWIRIQYMYVPGDYVNKLTTLYASNNPPDVFVIYKQNALQWAEQGKLYDLNAFLSSDVEINRDTLIPNSIMYWDKNKVAGIKATEESFALYYNVELFREEGIEPPPTKAENAWTWDQFVETAKKLTLDRNGNNATNPAFDPEHIVRYGVRFNTWMWHLMVPSNNASVIAEDGSGLNLEDPAVIEAVQKLADLVHVHHVAPSPTQEKSLPAPALALQSKKVAMDLNGQWVQLDHAVARINYGVGVLPKLKSSKTVQFGEPVVMSYSTKHPEEAWLFYKWILNADHSLDMHASGLWMPTIKKYYTEPDLIAKWAKVKPGHPDGYEDAVMRQTLDNGVNAFEYYVRNLDKIAAIINPALDQVWLGKKSVDEAFRSVSARVNAEYRGTYP